MWKDYFDFTYQEKRGILFILGLIILIFLAGFIVMPPKADPSFDHQMLLAELQEHLDQAQSQIQESSPSIENTVTHSNYFPFDPNSLSMDEGKSLNLSEKQIRMIQSYTSKGGKFKQPTDLLKIYSISEEDYNRLKDWIHIPFDSSTIAKPEPPESIEPELNLNDSASIIQLNQCNLEELLALDCLNPALAERIIKFRDKLGGFYSADQLIEVYGLNSKCLNRLMHRTRIDPSSIRKISINFASKSELGSHPYIGHAIAGNLDQFRITHGFIREAETLKKANLFDPEKLERLIPYLSFQE
jgi:competence protein ComEA